MYNTQLELLKQFDLSILNDLNYKEDAMREDILTPLMRALGYENSGKYKLVRTRALKHPFFHLGTRKKEVSLIPDYLLEIDGNIKCVIEAKSPCINIGDPKVIEQIYSYAFHPEIMSEYFCLCNGKEIVIYKINSPTPVFKESMYDVIKGDSWEKLYHLLSVQALSKPHTLNLKKHNIISEISLKATIHFINWAKPNEGLDIDQFVTFIIGFPIIDLSWRIGFELSINEILESITDDELIIQINDLSSKLRAAGFTSSNQALTPDLLKLWLQKYLASYYLDRQEDEWTYSLTRTQCFKSMLSEEHSNDKDGFRGLMEAIINRMRGRVKKNVIK